MPIDRLTVIAGPAKITYAGQSFWSKGDIVETPVVAGVAIQTSSWGEVDSRERDRKFQISFEPDGRFSPDLAAILWPYGSLAMGASLIGATDRALVVHGRDGKKRTYHNAALTKLPDFNASTGRTIQGSVTFTAIGKNNTDPTDAAAFYTDATEAYPGDTGWDVADIITEAYTGLWGVVAPWDAFETVSGFVVSFGLNVYERKADSVGIIDLIMNGMTVTAKATPLVSRAAVAAKMRVTGGQGSSIAAGAADLEIDATTAVCKLMNASIVDSKFQSGTNAERVGETTWRSTRTVTSGALDPLFYIGDI